MPVPAGSNMRLATRLRRSFRRDPSLFFMPALLTVSLAVTLAIHPQFSDFDLQSLAMGALPLAFAAAAQTVVVIAGGIDLSIGSVMAVTNVLAAGAMEKASFGQSLLLAVAVLMAGAAVGAAVGIDLWIGRLRQRAMHSLPFLRRGRSIHGRPYQRVTKRHPCTDRKQPVGVGYCSDPDP